MREPEILWVQGFRGMGRQPLASGDWVGVPVFVKARPHYSFKVFSSQTGRPRMALDLPAGGYAAPVLGDHTILLPSGFTRLVGADIATGRVRWTVEMLAKIRSTPAVDGGSLYIADGPALREIGLGGRETGRGTVEGAVLFGRPVVDPGRAYVLGAEPQAQAPAANWLYCFDRSDLSRVLWRAPAGPGVVATCDTAGPAADPHRIYVGCLDGTALAVEKASGQVVWSYATGHPLARSWPAVGEGAVYWGSLSGRVFALEAATGALRFERDLDPEGIWAPPALCDRLLLVHAGNRLFALDAATGEEVWQLPIGHSPYTAPVVAGRAVYICGGDPPDWCYLFRIDPDCPARGELGSVHLELQGGADARMDIRFRAVLPSREPPGRVILDIRPLGAGRGATPVVQGEAYSVRSLSRPAKRFGRYALAVRIQSGKQSLTRMLEVDLLDDPGLPPRHCLEVPVISQESWTTSGPTALSALLSYHGKPRSPAEVQAMADHLDSRGVHPHHKWRSGAVRIAHSRGAAISDILGGIVSLFEPRDGKRPRPRKQGGTPAPGAPPAAAPLGLKVLESRQEPDPGAGLPAFLYYDPYFPRFLTQVRRLLAAGMPLLVRLHPGARYPMPPDALSRVDLEGHVVLIVGFDDEARSCLVMDPWDRDRWGGARGGLTALPYDLMRLMLVDYSLGGAVVLMPWRIETRWPQSLTPGEWAEVTAAVTYVHPEPVAAPEHGVRLCQVLLEVPGGMEVGSRNPAEVRGGLPVGETRRASWKVRVSGPVEGEAIVTARGLITPRDPYPYCDVIGGRRVDRVGVGNGSASGAFGPA
ncbi:MAG: PQQ-like beta-propeller repeat protein [Acetobacteraceae bacterium]|nr:PQQ-like beta-propeller repeat protein [Acetobacteraceae bacterium]